MSGGYGGGSSKRDTSVTSLPIHPPRVGHYSRANLHEFAHDPRSDSEPWTYLNDTFFSKSAKREKERRFALISRTRVMEDKDWGKSIKLETDDDPIAPDAIVDPCDMLDLIKQQNGGEGTYEPLVHLPTGHKLRHTQGSYTTTGGVKVEVDRYDVYHYSQSQNLTYVGRRVSVQWADDRIPPAKGSDTSLREYAFLWDQDEGDREELIDQCYGQGYLPGDPKAHWSYFEAWSRQPVEE